MKLKNILFIAIAILTIGLFVACNDEVVATKDNNVAYTQVLESNGAFEYNGTKYETLQDAIEAIDKAKAYPSKTIKVLKDVNSDGATVPATAEYIIILDLNGKTLSFLSANGITVDGRLYVTGDGEFAFSEGVTDGTAITVSGTGAFYVEDAKFNVPGQNAVKATGGTVYLRDNTEITGNIEASGTSTVNLRDNSKFTEKGTVTIGTGATVSVSTTNKPTMVLNLEGGTLEVSSKVALDEDSSLDSGVIVLPSGATDNYIEKPESLDISQITMSTGLFSISRTTGMTYYKSLQDAIVEYESSDLVITQIFADTTAASIGVEKCVSGVTTVKINTKNNGDTSDIGALTVSAGYTLEVTGNGTVTSVNLGSTTGDTPTYGTLVVTGTDTVKPVISEVTGTGVVNSENAIFNGTIACTTLTDGANGSGSTFKGAITAKGLISLSGSILDPSSDDDHFVYTDATDNGVIASITLSGVTFDDGTENVYAGVFSYNGGSISISNSIGIARSITATGTTPNSIVINNSSLSSGSSLTVMNEVASRGFSENYSGQVTITGSNPGSVIINKIDAASIAIHYATVKDVTGTSGDSGARAMSGNFVSDNSVFESWVGATGNLTDGDSANGDSANSKNGSTFKSTVDVDGTAVFYKSKFDPSGENTSLTASTVIIGESEFSNDSGDYDITAEKTYSDYDLKQEADDHGATYIAEDTLTISNSTGVVGDLKTTGNKTYTTSGVDPITYKYYSDILVDNSSISSGTLSVGAVSSTNAGNTVFGDVTVKGNSPTTGDDPKSRAVTVASIPYAYDVKTSYAVVTGNIGSDATKVATVSDGWTENSNVGKSEFNGNIYASGAGTFNNSIFAPTSSGATAGDKNLKALSLSISESTFTKTGTTPTYVYSLEATKEFAAASNAISISSSNGSIGTITASNAGSISIESTTGEIGNISLSATTDSSEQPSVGSIVINNSAFSEASTPAKTLSTGSISARYVYDTGSDPDKYVYGDITVRGGSASNTVTVASIPYANNVKTSYAVVTGDIGSDTDTTKVKTVSDGWTVSESTTPGYSTFNGNIYASGEGTFNDSTFSASGSDKTLTAGEVTINRGTFVANSSDYRYNVNSTIDSEGNGVTINDSTGYLGAVTSNWVITINNDDATDDLFIKYRSGDTNMYAVKANGHSIQITGPNASGKKIDITGQISGLNVKMYASGTGYSNDNSLVVNGIEGQEIVVSASGLASIYGGTYGKTESFSISGSANIHRGVFYVNNASDLNCVVSGISKSTEHPVDIYLKSDIKLTSPLVVGYRDVTDSSQDGYVYPNKTISFYSNDSSKKTITIPYYWYDADDDDYHDVDETFYYTYPIDIKGGTVVFNNITLNCDSLTAGVYSSYSYSSDYVLWFLDNTGYTRPFEFIGTDLNYQPLKTYTN